MAQNLHFLLVRKYMQIDIENLDNLKLTELRDLAKELDIKSISQVKKNDLIEKIKEIYKDKEEKVTGEEIL